MKLTISAKKLLSAAQSVSRIISPKSALPILYCILLDIKENEVFLTASDSDTRISTSIAIDTAKEDCGTIAINAKRLLEVLKNIPDQPIHIVVNEHTLETTITTSSGRFDFFSDNADAYPIKQSLADDHTEVFFPSSILLAAINRTIFAAANDDFRPTMAGVYFDLYKDSVAFVATDSHKLARITNTTIQCGANAGVIIPTRPLSILKSILDKGEASVSLAFDSNRAIIKTPNFTISLRLIEGKYPNYNGVIPQINTFNMTIERNALIAAIKRVSVFTNPAERLIRLDINGCTVKISSQDAISSTAAEEILMCQSNTEKFSIGLSATVLSEILANITGEETTFHLGDATRAILITPSVSAENESILYLLMPMILKS